MMLAHLPPESLRTVVAAAHGYRAPAYPAGVHRGLPSRYLTLVVELLAPLQVAGLGRTVAAHGVVGGLHLAPALIDATRAQEGVQYALTPFGTQALLGASAAELRGHAVDLVDVLGAGGARVLQRLHEAADWTQRFRVLDEALVSRLDVSAASTPAPVLEAWRVIMAGSGRVPIASVAAHVGWGRRHLSERFRHATGLTPKEAARIARFEAVGRLLRSPGRVPLAEVAARCGYADQAHLAREWRALTGCSLGTWAREELPFLQDTPVRSAPESLP